MNEDIIVYIYSFLTDKDKINFLITSKNNKLYNRIIFTSIIHIKKVKQLNPKYFNQFTNLICDNVCVYPKYIKKLTLDNTFNQIIKDSVPNYIRFNFRLLF